MLKGPQNVSKAAHSPTNEPSCMPPAWSVHNHIYQLESLQNRYVTMRHGQSTANVARIVVTDPAIGTKAYGLTDLGTEQAEKSVQEFLKAHPQS